MVGGRVLQVGGAASLYLGVFTLLASLSFLYGTGLISAFDHPYYQWWEYAWTYSDVPQVRTWLLLSGAPSAFFPALIIAPLLYRRWRFFGTGWRNRFWRPRMDQRDWVPARLPAPPIIGATDNYGHARWATEEEMRRRWPAPRASHGGLAVGELYDPRLLTGQYNPLDKASWGPGGIAPLLYDDCMSLSGHSVRIGGSGSGKTESLKLSLRTTWTGPVVVLDPKQTLGPELKEARNRMGRRVIIVNPEHADSCGQDVLDWIDPVDPLVDPKIDDVVEWVCGETPEHGGGDNTKFFTGAAKDMVRCLISHMIADSTCDPAIRTLRTARAVICMPSKDFRKTLAAIHETSPSPRAKQLAALVCSEENDTFRGIHYTAQRISAWLSTEAWATLVCGSAYKASDVIDDNVDIFLGIPFQSLTSEPAVARCLLGALFNAMFLRKGRHKQPVLFALDEVAQLRQFDPLTTAWTMGREFGVRLHLMYQANGQITKQWGPGGKSTIRNGAGWLAYSAVKDPDDAKELEETIGNYPVVALSESMQTGTQGRMMQTRSRSRGNTVTYSEMARPRIRHEEIIGLREDAQLIFAGGIRPMICGLPLDYRRRTHP